MFTYLNDNTLTITEHGEHFVYHPGHKDHSDLRDLDTKIITIVFARNNELTISELVSIIHADKNGMQFPFISPQQLLKVVSFLIKYDYIRYNVLPDLDINVEVERVKHGKKAR